jgi:hypothetical protein
MENAASFLQLLAERQAQGMNTLEDRPEWLQDGEDHGQDTVFQGFLEGHEEESGERQDTGAVKNTAGDPTNTAGWNWRNNKRGDEASKALEKEKKEISLSALANENTLSLTNTFVAAQEDRVQTYNDYEQTFNMLIKHSRLADYPMLCGEITARFAAISNLIIAVVKALRGKSDDTALRIAAIISAIQEQEKEKLAVVAASHLDRVQEVLTAGGESRRLRLGAMEHAVMPEYTKKRILEINGKIMELSEEIVGMKCDLLDC